MQTEAMQPEGRIVVGGDFTSNSNSLARFEGMDPTPPAAPEDLMATPGYTGADLTGTSTANWFGSRQRWANAHVSGVDEAGMVQLVARGAPVQAIVDVTAFYLADGETVPVGEPATGSVAELEAVVLPAATEDSLFVLVPPKRVYDSRAVEGPIAGGQSRTTTVLPASGQVPPGVGAVAYNLTETDTAGRGHLRVAPRGSPINWYSDGMRLANGLVVDVANDQVITFARATTSGGTNYIVDIVRYYF